MRRFVSRVGTHLARLTNPESRGVADPLSGFFALRRSVVEDVELSPRGYKILLEILVKGAYDRVVEVPYVFSQRRSGESNLTADEYIHFLEHLIVLWGRDEPDQPREENEKVSTRPGDSPGGAMSDSTRPDVALVTPYPPANDGIADYAMKLIDGYRSRTDSTIILGSGAETIETTAESDVEARHLWEKNDLRGVLSLTRELWRVRKEVDLIHFNIKPTYFGSRNVLRFLSLLVPLFARFVPGPDTVVTMHDILEGVDADDIGEQVGVFQRLGGAVATQLVLLSGPVTVTTAEYRDLLESKYPFATVRHVPHGVTRTDGANTVRTDPFRLLLFGYISPYKDYETVIEAFEYLRDRLDNVELWLVGDSHPDYAAYAERVRDRYTSLNGVRSFGYVEENKLPELFSDASLLVLPYKTAPGVSGPYQEAKAHGLPVIVYDNDDVLRATVETGGEVVTTRPGDPEALATTVEQLSENPERLQRMAAANLEATDPNMTEVVDRIFDVAGVMYD